MPRQSKNILETLATLPWWASVITAVFVYVAMAFIIPALAGKNMFAASFAKGLAQIAPYGFLLFLVPVPLSLFNSWRKRKQLDAQKDIDSIRELSWQYFEELVGEAYRRQGYRVGENDSAGPDGGIDLVIQKDGKRYLVQCKQWRSQKVGVKIIREMFGLVAAEKAAGGIVITSGQFTRGASEFARGKSLELMDGEQLAELISTVQNTPMMSTPLSSKNETKTGASSVPSCPVCNGTMVLRTARKGKNIGRQFWGCQQFPKCKGTREFSG